MMLLTKASINTLTVVDKPKLKTARTEINKAMSPTANQVIIIHQTNDIYSSSMSSSSSSSFSAMNQQNDLIDSIDNINDVKYTKGYVNVIRERFARRSINDKMQQEDKMQTNQGVIRLSINDYQKRKQQSSNSTHNVVKTRTASVDYQRRRSVSPFSCHNFLPTNKATNNSDLKQQHLNLFNKNNNDLTDNKSMNSLSSPSQSSASPSPLSSNYSSPTNGTNDDYSAKVNEHKSEIIKCTYSNEINKDELPRANFVSSVKNLFEKQIINSVPNTDKLRSRQRQSLVETVPLSFHLNSPNRSVKHNTLLKKSVSIESLVDRLKQNGTLVYEHNEKENIDSIQENKSVYNQEYMQSDHHCEPLSPVSLNINVPVEPVSKTPPTKTYSSPSHDLNDTSKALTFKERKDMFSKSNNSLKLNFVPKQNQHLNKRQKIDLHVDKFDESSDFINDEDSLSSDTSLNRLDDSKIQLDDSLQIDNVQAMTANEVFNSANENQKTKKSKTPVKVITFYGGEEIKDVKSLNLQMRPLILSNTLNNSLECFQFEFINAGVKLEKSNLVINMSTNNTKRNRKKLDTNGALLRVNFTDTSDTYEYPSYEFMLKELGIDPSTDPDYQIVTQNDQFSNGFNSFLPGKSFSSSDYDDENEKTGSTDDSVGFNKLGSFTNFKPSWHNMNYELGTMDSYDHHNSLSHHRNNSTTITSSSSSPLRLNMNGDSFIINDILPSKDENSKRWSSEMDSNILF